MSTAILRKTSLPRLLHGHLRNPIRETHQILCTQTPQSRAYLRFPRFLRKIRKYELSPSLFTSSFSSSSTTSSSRVRFIGWYLGMVKSRPVFTKSVTAALVYTAADLSSQTIAGSSSESYDLLRTLRMAGYGMLIIGPSLHFWFNLMSKLFPNRDLITTLKKMVMGQTLYGPAVTVVFFSVNAYLQGESSVEIVARLKRDFVPAMINSVMYWPLCDFITFRFVPVHLQPLVSNSFSYLWNVYMTYMAGLDKVDTSSS